MKPILPLRNQLFLFFILCLTALNLSSVFGQTQIDHPILIESKKLISKLKYQDAEKKLLTYFESTNSNKSSKSTAIAYDLLSDIQLKTGNNKKMHEYSTKLLPYALELKDTLLLTEVYNRFGVYELYEGNEKASENYFHKALSLGWEKKQSQKTGELYGNIASNYFNAGKKEKAIEWFFKALSLKEKFNDEKGQGETLSNIASVYYLMNRIDDAIIYQKKSIDVREKTNDVSGLVITHLNIGQMYILKNEMDEAYKHLKKSSDYATQTQNDKLMASSYSGLATYYNRIKNYEEALIWYRKAMQMFETADNKPLLSRLYVSAGNVAKELKDTASATNYYQKGLEYSLLLKNKENISNAYEKLSQYYQELNQSEKALKYYKSFVTYKDSINSTSNLAKIEEIRTQYETEKKDNEIAKLNTQRKIDELQIDKQNAIIAGNLAEAQRIQNEIDLMEQAQILNDLKIKQQEEQLIKQELIAKTHEQELQLAKQQEELNQQKLSKQLQFRNLMFIGIGLLGLLAFILFNRYKLKKKLENQEALLAVRNHIARDLHDKVGSTLTGIKILSEVSAKTMDKNQDKTLSFIQQITEQTKSIQQEMSDIVWAINPNNDKIENLVVRMREYLAQTLEPKDISIEMNVEKNVLDQHLNMNSRKEFFLIFREAVNNIAKHSEAKQVQINVSKNGSNLVMNIYDDGIGMDTQKITSSNGLKNMKDRSEMLKGSLEIESEFKKGTKLRLEFPTT